MIFSNKTQLEMRTLSAICEYISNRGFKQLDTLSFNETEAGINSTKFILKDRENLLRFSNLLGKFHLYGAGFLQPPGTRVRVRWGKLPDKFKRMTQEIKKINLDLNHREDLNDFEKLYLSIACGIEENCEEVIGVLQSDQYLSALSSSMENREICLNRISDNSAIMDGDTIKISGLNFMGYNMAIEDLAKLIDRIPAEEDSKILKKEIVSVYYDARELEDSSLKVLNAITTYPLSVVRLIIKYSKHLEDEKTCLKKLNSIIKNN